MSMGVTVIEMDGKQYRLRLAYNTMTRSFSLESGENEGYMLSRRHERDLAGTAYTYEMGVEPDPAHPEDYDKFWEDISAPVDSHTITLPYAQSTITYEAEIQSGEDHYRGRLAGKARWNGLTVRYIPIEPQRPSQ